MKTKLQIALALLVSAAACATQAEETTAPAAAAPAVAPSEEVVSNVQLQGPTVVAFFPLTTKSEMADPSTGAADRLAKVREALKDTMECLQSSGVHASAQIESATVLAVTDGSKSYRLDLPPGAIGGYLLVPSRTAQLVVPEDASASIDSTLARAAGKYFSAKACRRK